VSAPYSERGECGRSRERRRRENHLKKEKGGRNEGLIERTGGLPHGGNWSFANVPKIRVNVKSVSKEGERKADDDGRADVEFTTFLV